ncbi:MAG: methyl-accepting chemotaxis protein [Treponema sp.]|nr:methyl-accepting chemotaxis protein [Treponema sp.]MCL2237225.1 methyl-accepting chemotaxis protein [Treponema sp.]
MSLKIKLTSIIIVMVLVAISILSVVTLSRSSSLQTSTTFELAAEMAELNSIEIARRMELFTMYGKILSQLFGDYQNMSENTRRGSFDDFLRGTIQQNPLVMGIWTAWLPNTIDSRDAELGQYQTYYSRRRTGDVELLEDGYEGWENFLANMTTRPEIASPVWRDIYGYNDAAVISVMFPVKNQSGNPVGLVGINYISDIQEIVDVLVKQVYDGHGVAAVYAHDGVILAHYDKNRIKDNISVNADEIELLGEQHGRVVSAIKNGGENGKSVVIDRYASHYNSNMHLIFQPITVDGIDTPWNLLLGIPMNEIERPIQAMIVFVLIFAAVILGIVSIVTFFTANRVVKPIIDVTRTLKDISEGEGDLTRRIENNSNDEVGILSRYFNNTLEKIQNLVVSIKEEAHRLSDTAQDLSSNMNQTAAAVNQITSNIQSIKGRVINQSASVSQTHATMESVTVNIHKLNDHVEEQSLHVSQASSAIEQMVANIQSVTDTLIKNGKNVKVLREASEVGKTGLQDVASDIKEIARESEGLLEINSVMENIASQTNLLSMNAAIEAAHAGDAGRGFAVVSDEIRKLAESASEQSKTIGVVLKKIKESIDNITNATENVLNRFEAIDNGVKIVAEQEDIIRSAMEEQGEGSKQVLSGISQVNDITRDVKSGSHEMFEGAKEVIKESDNLEKVTQEITSGMKEMATGADQINDAVNHVKTISGLNRDGIDALMKEVSRFKVA